MVIIDLSHAGRALTLLIIKRPDEERPLNPASSSCCLQTEVRSQAEDSQVANTVSRDAMSVSDGHA